MQGTAVLALLLPEGMGGVGSDAGSLGGDILFQALGTTRNALEWTPGLEQHLLVGRVSGDGDPTLGRGPLLSCLESAM